MEQNTANLFKVENRSFLYGAPELIIVSTTATDNVGYSNAAIIAHDMSLAAVDEGVGVCHIWGCILALATNQELIMKLGIPKGFTPACAVAIGQTNETYLERNIPEDRIGINVVQSKNIMSLSHCPDGSDLGSFLYHSIIGGYSFLCFY